MSDESNQERRAFTRVPVHHRAQLRDASGRTVYDGVIADISLGGVLVNGGPTELTKDADVRVSIVLEPESGSTIEAAGRVIRVSSSGVAVIFDEVDDPESLAHLKNLVLYNAEATETVEAELRNRPGISRD